LIWIETRMLSLSLNEIIWQTVALIPKGQVASYGQIARLSGYPSHARYVGSTLKKLPKNSKLPWFRVINAQGKISFPLGSDAYVRQYRLLTKEGIEFNSDKVLLKKYAWDAS